MNQKQYGWLCVFLAGITEIVWAIAMDYSDGFTIIWFDLIVIAFLAIGMYFLTKALSSGLPVGTVYSVWVGIGAVGTAVMSKLLNLEDFTVLKAIFISMIIIGIIGLKILADKKDVSR